MPGPSGFGSAEIERCNVALKSETARLDTKNVIVSFGLADSLSEYPAINTSCMIAQFFVIENRLIKLRDDSHVHTETRAGKMIKIGCYQFTAPENLYCVGLDEIVIADYLTGL